MAAETASLAPPRALHVPPQPPHAMVVRLTTLYLETLVLAL